MATFDKNFVVKNGIVVNSTVATVNGNQVLTEASSINALNDVTITSATTNQVLKFNGTVWVNDTDATGGGGGGGLTVSDTAPGSPSEGDLWFNSLTGRTYLYYDGYWIEWDTYQVGIVTATGATINTFNAIEISGQGTIVADSSADTLTLVAGTFVSITTTTASDSITFSASHSHAIDDLSDVTITSATTGQVLKYNGTAWVNDTHSNNAFSMGGYESGLYYGAYHDANAVSTTAVEDQTYYHPFYVSETTTFDRITCRTGSGFSGTAEVRLGIYNNSTNRPDSLLLDAGTVSCTNLNTLYQITINQELTPGWYWLAFNSQTAAATNAYTHISPVLPYGYMLTQTNYNRTIVRTETGITGAFTTAGTLNTNSQVNTPGVLLRAV